MSGPVAKSPAPEVMETMYSPSPKVPGQIEYDFTKVWEIKEVLGLLTEGR